MYRQTCTYFCDLWPENSCLHQVTVSWYTAFNRWSQSYFLELYRCHLHKQLKVFKMFSLLFSSSSTSPFMTDFQSLDHPENFSLLSTFQIFKIYLQGKIWCANQKPRGSPYSSCQVHGKAAQDCIHFLIVASRCWFTLDLLLIKTLK